ncbi:MAG: SCO family protein [Usitatibacter sp.]
MNPQRRLLTAAMVFATLGLAACDKLFFPAKGPFQGVDVTGGDMGGELRLTDHNGRPRTLADFRGKVVVVIFGYTQCPDVCPTSLADVASAMKLLGDDAKGVQVLFVTVDPKRDTPELLRQYVPAFHPDFLGLYGDEASVSKVTKDFHVYASERAGKTADSYTVDHSAQIFMLDKAGKARVLMPPGTAPAAMASDLKVLLNS